MARPVGKGVFKKWSRKDLLSNDRVYTSRYVYKPRRSALTGEVYGFQARLIVRGFQMEKVVDFDDSFSPTPGLAFGRLMLSLAVANDYGFIHAILSKLSCKPIRYPKDAGEAILGVKVLPRGEVARNNHFLDLRGTCQKQEESKVKELLPAHSALFLVTLDSDMMPSL
jgi:hypothetical protein